MRRPVWFRAARLGKVPVHWAPVAWQGWAVVGAYVAALLWGLSLRRSPTLLLVVECGLLALVIAVAALTDDRLRGRGTREREGDSRRGRRP